MPLMRIFGFGRKKVDLNLSRQDVLSSRPVRNSIVKWEPDAKNEVSIIIPQKNKLWVKVVSKIFMLPSKRVLVLDDVGSYVWVMCDSKSSINDIIKSICEKYNLTRKEAETSLLIYLRQLGKKGLIGFAVPKKEKKEKKEKERKGGGS